MSQIRNMVLYSDCSLGKWHHPKSSTGCFLQCPILAGQAIRRLVKWFGLVGWLVCLLVCFCSLFVPSNLPIGWMIFSINGLSKCQWHSSSFLATFLWFVHDLICKLSTLTWSGVASSNLSDVLSRCRWTNSSTDTQQTEQFAPATKPKPERQLIWTNHRFLGAYLTLGFREGIELHDVIQWNHWRHFTQSVPRWCCPHQQDP